MRILFVVDETWFHFDFYKLNPVIDPARVGDALLQSRNHDDRFVGSHSFVHGDELGRHEDT